MEVGGGSGGRGRVEEGTCEGGTELGMDEARERGEGVS